MAKFTYGGLPRVIKEKGYLPGHYTRAFGPRYVDSGLWDSNSSILPEFGEFVEVNVGDDYAKEALTVVASTTAAELAIVLRDVAGFPALGGGMITGPKANVPLSLFIGTAGNKGKAVAILGEQNSTPAVGGQVYVGTGVTTTIAATALVAGTTYTILTAGTTDYTTVGAADSEVGTTFVATGVAEGTGTVTNTTEAGVVYATNIGTACISATNWKFASTKFAPTLSGKYVVEVEYVG